ncbi:MULTISPECIES: thiamine phosphate synthase [Cryobacterium]|uniref:thiamine phosphate synthase n=1 Tax=Cryobacterium TaxID=69578 RepID=UPI000CD47EB7|nr:MULTISPECIES: thiamine phosphate synthase [Cryobacterium]POH63574.1 thiamine phosphate synthase [Cryobacterium zongtaii]TFC42087.1 thiamine phosphate synthase [Cryobacterium sp. TMN-39-2]
MSDLSLYLVTDTALCGARGVLRTVIDAVAGGITTVQVRDKTGSDDDVLRLLLQVADAVGDRATVVVNDRVDVYLRALAERAAVHGLHVGQGDEAVARVRDRVGSDAIVGITANTPAELDRVFALPAGTVDYLGVGVIRATSTKPDHPPVLGVPGFAALAATSALSCVAIGGIGLADVWPLRRAGAAGVAVVSAVCAAPDARAAASALHREWTR